MEQLQRIQIGNNSYPIKMDLNVLEQIQDNYESIKKFEMDILGLDYIKDEAGKYVLDESGKPRMYMREPQVKAIRTALYPMINEGLEIEAEETGKELQLVTREAVERDCTIDYKYLADVIHEEFKRCFSVKKKTTENRGTAGMMSR